jgi:hypothetical protein
MVALALPSIVLGACELPLSPSEALTALAVALRANPTSCTLETVRGLRQRLAEIPSRAGVDARFALRELLVGRVADETLTPEERLGLLRLYGATAPPRQPTAELRADAAMFRETLPLFRRLRLTEPWHFALITAVKIEQQLPAEERTNLYHPLDEPGPNEELWRYTGYVAELAELLRDDAVLTPTWADSLRSKAGAFHLAWNKGSKEDILQRCAHLRRVLAAVPDPRLADGRPSAGWRYKPLLHLAVAEERAGSMPSARATLREAIAFARDGSARDRMMRLSSLLSDVERLGAPDFDRLLLKEVANEVLGLAGESSDTAAVEARERARMMIKRADPTG